MSIAKYIWRNCKRNRARSLLTGLSIAVGTALVTLLFGAMAIQQAWCLDTEKYNRVVVTSNQGLLGTLPVAHLAKIRSIEGVDSAVPFTWFGGAYEARSNPFAQFATDPSATLDVWHEFTLPTDQFESWKNTRIGCIASRELAERWKWRIGQSIRLEGRYYPFDLQLELSGIFDAPRYSNSLLFHWEYLDAEVKRSAPARAGNAGFIYAKVRDSAAVATVAQQIDEKFANSSDPTTSQSESAFSLMFVDMIGDVWRLIQIISMAVCVSLMLVTANSIAMSTRDRRFEFAVLRALGFPQSRIFMTVVGESTLLSILGCACGQLTALGLLELLHRSNPRMFPSGVADIIGLWFVLIFVAALGMGILSAIIPAAIAARVRIIDAMRAV